MTTLRDNRTLFAGILLGVAITVSGYFGTGYVKSRQAASTASMANSMQAKTPSESLGNASQSMAGKTISGQPNDEMPSVELTQEEEKAIGIQTALVKRQNIQRTLRTVGRVEQAETQLSTISARIGGRLDKLDVQFTGQPVHKGEAVASIYSPEVVTSAEEYKLALENLTRLKGEGLPEAVEQKRQLVSASRRRLELWGITEDQIKEIAKATQPNVHITIYSQANGTVTERKVTEGQYVKEGDVLFTLSDLSAVWVKADVYEADLPMVRSGQPVEITTASLPGAILRGRVNFIEPMLTEQTRTVSVRIEVLNPALRLRPGMFVQAEFQNVSGEKELAVPRSAVVDTGMHKMVFVAKGNGIYEGRKIETGFPNNDIYPVISGLREGERIVTQGTFMVDSQSRLSGGMGGQFGGSKEFTHNEADKGANPEAGYQITLSPDTVKGGEPNQLHLMVIDQQGKPVDDAEVNVRFFMPAMPSMGMGSMDEKTALTRKGNEYTGSANVPMAGSWNVTVEVNRNGKRVATKQVRVNAK